MMDISTHLDLNQNKINDQDSFLLVDFIIDEDISNTVCHENYFIFDELLRTFLRRLIRDKNLIKEIRGSRPIILLSPGEYKPSMLNKVEDYKNEYVAYPPSGLIPFPGLASQLACFCYISTNINDIYLVGRSFFVRYLSFLSSFTTNPNSVLSLLYNFDYILETDKRFDHLNKHFSKLGFNSHITVLNWLSKSFSDLLTPVKILTLYDIIIVTESTSILVTLSLAIFHYKKHTLLSLNTKEEILKLLDYLKYENLNLLDILYDYLNS